MARYTVHHGTVMMLTSDPSTPWSISPASYSEAPLVGLPSMATMMSPAASPALSAGPPGAGVTTYT